MPVPRLACGAAPALTASISPGPTVKNSAARRRVKRSAIALLRPGIAMVVVSPLFPEARAVGGDEFDAPDPFGALPEIELRHDRAHRPAMLAGERLPLPGMRQQYIVIGEIGERQVGRVIVIAVEDEEARLGLGAHDREEVTRAHPLPFIVEARPGGDAMDVRGVAEGGLGAKRRPVPGDGVLDEPVDGEPPAPCGHVGLDAEIEDGPILDPALPRRQTLLLRTRGAARQEPAVARPALLRFDELAARLAQALLPSFVHKILRRAPTIAGFIWGRGRIRASGVSRLRPAAASPRLAPLFPPGSGNADAAPHRAPQRHWRRHRHRAAGGAGGRALRPPHAFR